MNLKFPIFVAAAICAQTAGATTFAVPAGGNLQSVLDNVQSGDTVTLQAGATYVGHFRLKANPGNQTITIQSSNMGALPPGKRVSANDADAMPKLITPDGNAALWMTTGANYYRIQGIEFRPANGVYAQDVIQVGVGSETSVDQLPHDIDFDRVYVHGDPSAGSKRGIALNGGNTTVENSYFSAFTSTWQDTQALCGWNGPGPYKIINNYLEAGTETVAFGGAVPAIYGVVPSDILVQNNNFFKPLSWKPGDPSYAGVPVLVKNHLELKSGQRVTIDGNVLENNWIGADQRGSAFVFTVRTEVNRVPWAVVNDITITNNIIRHSPAGMLVAGHDDNPAGSGSSGRFMVRNNIWQDISSSVGGDGRLFTVLSGVQGITFDHNTAFQSGWIMVFDGGTSYNVNYTNNITAAGWGVAGNGTGVGIPTLNAYAGGGTFSRNVLIGASPNQYPSDNFFPSNVDQVGFTNYGAGNFLLSSGSSYRGAGTDSKDLGSSLVTQAGSANNSGVPLVG